MPDNPAAWLIQVAKNRLLDRLRRELRWNESIETSDDAARLSTSDSREVEALYQREVKDDQLRMIFTCCHPVVSQDGQIALTLKTVGGFSVSEIARALLTQPAAIAKILTRSKQKLRDHEVTLEMPEPGELSSRLSAVLQVIYLMFNEGYSALKGDELVRKDLCHEALRLCDLLAEHPVTGVPRVHALASLLAFQAARLPARSDIAGEMLLLPDQDRTLWDSRLIRRALDFFKKSATGGELSDYHLEAEIAGCHSLAARYEDTDWRRVFAAYDELAQRNPSPVIALNRIIAYSKVNGVEAGLAELESLSSYRVLDGYYPYHATRGEMLRETGRSEEATQELHPRA